jgi:hypothetical protein
LEATLFEELLTLRLWLLILIARIPPDHVPRTFTNTALACSHPDTHAISRDLENLFLIGVLVRYSGSRESDLLPLLEAEILSGSVEELDPQRVVKEYKHMHSRLTFEATRVNNGCKLIFTRNGIVGTARLLAAPGDSVVLFSGASMPSILRREGSNYRYLSPAYIEGIMAEDWGDSATLNRFDLI